MTKALFVPYAVALQYEGKLLWQLNLGAYLDSIGSLFDEVEIVCHVFGQENTSYFKAGKPIYEYEMQAQNIQIVPFPHRRPLAAVRVLYSHIRSADFVYSFLPSYKGLLAAVLCKFYGVPYGLYIGSNWYEVSEYILPRIIPKRLILLVSYLFGWIEHLAVTWAAFSIVHGQKIIERYDGKRVYSVVPILNWTLRDTYIRSDSAQGSPIRLLCVAILDPRKGLENLIRAMRIVRHEHTNLELVLIGSGTYAYEQSLRDLIKQLNLENMIRMPGYIADPNVIIEYYRSADIFVLPTLGEGFPRVIYEAMTQGLPVITTSTGSIPAVLKDGETALLVKPGSPEAIAEAIDQLLTSPPLRQRLIANGYELVRQRLGESTPLEQFRELFDRHVV